MKKLLAIIMPLVLVTSLLTGCIGSNKTANVMGYVSVDINPSIQFVTDGNDEVVSATASNEDGESLLLGRIEDFIGISVEDATEKVVELAIEFGFLDPEATETDPNAVSVTTMLENQDEEDENILRDKIKNRVQSFFKNNGVFGVVVTDIDMKDVLSEAQTLSVSPGRLKLIRSVQSVYPELTLEQALNSSVKDLMKKLRDFHSGEERTVASIESDIAAKEAELTNYEGESLLYHTEYQALLNELSTLENIDTTTLDEAALAQHNQELATVEASLQSIRDIELQNDEAHLALLAEIASLNQQKAYLESIEAQAAAARELAKSQYDSWLAQRVQRAADIQARWETFQNGLTEQQKATILEAMTSHWQNRNANSQ